MANQSDQSSAYGFPAPQGDDYIADGDDAITNLGNAVAYRLALGVEVTNRLTGVILDDGVDLNDVQTTGRWIAFSTRNHPNRPSSSYGVVDVFRFGSTAHMQVWTSAGLDLVQFKRYRGSTGWTAWERIDAGSILSLAKAYADSVTAAAVAPSGTKTVPLALTVGGGVSTYHMTTGGARLPIQFGAPVTRFRVHIRNNNPRWVNTYPGAVSLSGVWIGRHDGAGKFTGATTQISGATSTPADGSEWVSDWVTYPLAAGTPYLLAYGWTASAATQAVVGGGWTTAAPGDATSGSAAVTRRPTMPLDVWIEAETPAATPVIAVLGDSLSSGVGATLPVHDSVVSQLARTKNALPIHYTASGTSASSWTSATDHKWTRWDTLGFARPDLVLVGMGSNDAFTGSSLATMQADYTAMLNIARTKLSPAIHVMTVLPREGVTGTLEDVRRAFNTWLLQPGRGFRGAYNIVPAVSADDETLIDAYDSDGIHLTTAGYAAIMGVLPAAILPVSVGAAVMRAPDAAAARAAIGAAEQRDTGWRSLPLGAGATGGRVLARRIGDLVALKLEKVVVADRTVSRALVNSLPGMYPIGAASDATIYAAWSAFVGGSPTAKADGVAYRWGLSLQSSLNAGAVIDGQAQWMTEDAWPTTLPGTPA